MEIFAGIKEKNYKEAVALMRANNVTKIDFIDENDEQTICYIPTVIYRGWSGEALELFIKSVRIDDNDLFFITPEDDNMIDELNVDDLDYDTDNNIYFAIEEYFEQVKRDKEKK